MPRTLTSTIENESAKSRLRVVDLVKVTFPDPINTVYWSNSYFTYPTSGESHNYLPRIISMDSWTRSMNPETDNLTLVLGNVDGEITRIYNTVEMELAEVSLIRYYPDLDEAIDPLWVGWGGTITLNETEASWSIHFGFRGFTQRGLRKIANNCWKVFKDGVYCPYDGTSIGKCSTLNGGIDDVVTTVTVADSSYYSTAGDIILIDTEQMLITVVNGNDLGVTRAYNSTAAASHSNGATVYHNNCTKSKEACDRRHMFGPPTEESQDGKRYFGGWTNFIPDTFYQRGMIRTDISWLRLPYQQSVIGNPAVQGRIIPAVYGTYKLTGIPAVYSADAMQYRHSLFIVAEGECTAVAVNTIDAGGFPVDNNPPGYDAYPSEYDIYHNESCMVWWGTVGQRASRAMGYGVNLDQYMKNPYLINDATTGDGQSLSDLFVVRIRVEEGGDTFTDDLPDLGIQFVGRKVRTIQGWLDDNPALVTSYPDPIEVAVDYCVNGKFGARLDISRVNLTAAKLASDYCRELIYNTQEGYGQYQNARYLFNGAVNDDQTVEKQLAFILDNCFGYYIPNGGVMEFNIKKAEDLATIDALPWLMDYGPNRNILRENGKSTLEVEQTATTDGTTNCVETVFADASYGFQSNTLYIYDEDMQLLAGKILGS